MTLTNRTMLALEVTMKDKFTDIPKVIRAIDKFPIKLTYYDKEHIKAFRDILEAAMNSGRWVGVCYTDA